MKKILPFLTAGLFAAWLFSSLRPAPLVAGFDVAGFGRLPVLEGGRVKPLDSMARNSLLLISGRQTLRHNGERRTAPSWLLDVFFRPDRADAYKAFEINDPDVLGLMNRTQGPERRYSFADLQPSLGELEEQAASAEKVKPERRTRFQTAVVNLQRHVILYQRLKNTLQMSGAQNLSAELRAFQESIAPAAQAFAEHAKAPRKKMSPALAALTESFQRYQFLDQVAAFYAFPADDGGEKPWWTVGESLLRSIRSGELHPGVPPLAVMADAFRAQDPAAFNQAVAAYTLWLKGNFPAAARRAGAEALFNRVSPFYKSMVMYVAVLLLVGLSWLVWPQALNRSAFWLLVFAFTVHTVGLAARMVIQGRPPVTNLYSSAVFVGWVAVLLGLLLERLYRNGIGSLVSSVVGFLTLIIAHHLATQGDTLEMMRAVLDSNFWLATHVVTITIGYGSTFLAGFLGAIYIIRGVLTTSLNQRAGLALSKMIYGVVCFSAFFSFVGTILGGIWADQSWGRFWGWDPKENGALMIVLWNALVLHARWGGFAKPRGLAVLAVFGNVVTALSWFGVNMLGIGLHSYGFMDKAFPALMAFIAVQAVLMGLGMLPLERWRSFRTAPAEGR